MKNKKAKTSTPSVAGKTKSQTGWAGKLSKITGLLFPTGAKPGLTSAERLRLARLLMDRKQLAPQTTEPARRGEDFDKLLKAVFGKGGGDDGEDRSAQIIALFFALAKAQPQLPGRFAEALGKILIKANNRDRRELMEMLARELKVLKPGLASLMLVKLQGKSVTAPALAERLKYPHENFDSALRQAYRLMEEAGMSMPSKRGRPRNDRT
ncbi:MAG: hypothetical protein NT154_07520 [Verrucomicrobia bacterium]|nr:hypothetical protein [Verrucomicrobiota bacterium]